MPPKKRVCLTRRKNAGKAKRSAQQALAKERADAEDRQTERAARRAHDQQDEASGSAYEPRAVVAEVEVVNLGSSADDLPVAGLADLSVATTLALKRELKLEARKRKAAERYRKRLAGETDGERRQRLATGAEKARLRRSAEAKAQRRVRLAQDAGSKRRCVADSFGRLLEKHSSEHRSNNMPDQHVIEAARLLAEKKKEPEEDKLPDFEQLDMRNFQYRVDASEESQDPQQDPISIKSEMIKEEETDEADITQSIYQRDMKFALETEMPGTSEDLLERDPLPLNKEEVEDTLQRGSNTKLLQALLQGPRATSHQPRCFRDLSLPSQAIRTQSSIPR